MLARKVGYMRFQGAAPYPVDRHKAMAGARVEERNFSRVLAHMGFVVIVFGVLTLVYVALTAINNSYGYNLMQVKQQVGELNQENEQLRLDIAKMQTPERIYSIATKKLGMVAPAVVLYSSANSQGNTGEHSR